MNICIHIDWGTYLGVKCVSLFKMRSLYLALHFLIGYSLKLRGTKKT